MKKGLTEIVFILDRSGSMSGLEADTIGGFNSLIEKQKREKGKAIVSTVLLDIIEVGDKYPRLKCYQKHISSVWNSLYTNYYYWVLSRAKSPR